MKRPTTEYIETLKAACNWLKIDHGRAKEYVRRLEEFQKAKFRSNEHLLAYYESYEIVEIFRLWETRVDEFPGLHQKIRGACVKGRFLRDDQIPELSRNRSRHDSFCFLLAGRFLAAEIRVVCVDEIPSSGFKHAPNADFTLGR